jgi:hypothetical protein
VRASDKVPRRRRWARRLLLVTCLVPTSLLGCGGGQSNVSPVFLIKDEKEISAAISHGKRFCGKDPYTVLPGKNTLRVDCRLNQNVIVRTAARIRPADEVAFTVASLPPNTDDLAVKQTVDRALDKINRQLRFVVVLQLLAAADPNRVTFQMKSSTGHVYPPVDVAEPQLLQQLAASLDGDMPASNVYRYVVSFQTVESPGYPALDIYVSSLDLIIDDDGAQLAVTFPASGGA